MSRGRRYTFTLNNPVCLIEELYHPHVMSYLIAGEETAPSTGTRHFQGYLETHSKKSLGPLAKDLKELWGAHPKLFVSKGSAAENKIYCLKEGGHSTEQGAPMAQGARTDLKEVAAAIASGLTMKQLWTDFPEHLMKYSGGIRQCYLMTSPHTNQQPTKTYSLMDFPATMPTGDILEALKTRTVILYGKSGTGKTSYARTILPKALFVSHMDDLGKFDTGEHDGIIFDDLSLLHLPRESQIHILDKEQPRSIHIRYNTASIPAGTKKIFTTNNDGGYIYIAGDAALERRVKKFEIVPWDMDWAPHEQEMKWLDEWN